MQKMEPGEGDFRLREFHEYLTFERNLSEWTAINYEIDIRQFTRVLNARGITHIRGIGRDEVRAYAETLQKSLYSSNSIRRKLNTLKVYCSFLKKQGWIEEDPTIGIQGPKEGLRLPTYLKEEEINALVSAPEGDHPLAVRNRALLELMYSSGLRISEVERLRLIDVDLEEGVVTVRQGKGHKDRPVPLTERAVECLDRYLSGARLELIRDGEAQRKVFLNRSGRPLTHQGIRDMITKYAQAAGIKKVVTPHTIRHTFATHLAQHGANLRAIQDMLGHASISTTQIYTHFDLRATKEVHRACHPRALSHDKEEENDGSHVGQRVPGEEEEVAGTDGATAPSETDDGGGE